MGRQRLARSEVEEAARLNPRSPAVAEEVAWAALKSGNTGAAIRAVREMTPLYPFRSHISDPREGTGLKPPARRPLRGPLLRSIDSDVRFESERSVIGAILQWWANERGHLSALLEAREDRPNDLELLIALSLAAFDASEWELAYDTASTVVGRKPSLAIMHSIRGRALGKLGRWAEAQDPLARSVKGEAEQADLLMWAAQAHIEQGELARAEELLGSAEELAPWDPRIRQRRFALRQKKK